MGTQTPDVLKQRMSELMKKRYISKKDMAHRLNLDYSTFWRKANGERGVDVPLLMEIVKVLGTTAGYLLGETDIPDKPNNEKSIESGNVNLIIQTNDHSREIVSKPGHLTFRNGEVLIDIPDTPENKKWFNEFLNSSIKNERTLATA